MKNIKQLNYLKLKLYNYFSTYMYFFLLNSISNIIIIIHHIPLLESMNELKYSLLFTHLKREFFIIYF